MRLAPVLAALALVLAGCGGSGDDTGDAAGAPPPADGGPGHIHGLALDPADGSLLVGTHTGLYRVRDGSLDLKRVGEARNDTMGLAVLGPGHYLASGHPPQEVGDEPVSLGVIESTDAGETWRAIALEGEADLHAIRVAGDRVYGADGLEPRTFASDDGGRSWEERGPDAYVLDLAADPEDSDRVVGATRRLLLLSEDGGRTWAPHGETIGERVGVLAWPAPDALFVFEETGGLWRSADGGLTWRTSGGLERGDRPVALLAVGPDELYVALDSGEIRHSRDGGRTWRLRARA